MQRKPVNPWSWSLKLGFDQGQLIEGHQRQLVCSGQDAVDADGQPQHPGDMGAQLELALDNLDAVLAGGEMTFANVVPCGSPSTRRTSMSWSSTGPVCSAASETRTVALRPPWSV